MKKLKSDSFLFPEIFNPWKNRIKAGFTTRLGGISKPPYSSLNLALHTGDNPEQVLKNRRAFMEYLEADFSAYTCLNQTHSGNIISVNEEMRGRGRFSENDALNNCDAFITDLKETLLTVYVADCVPVLLFDSENNVIAACHGGWRGIAQNIVYNTVLKMQKMYKSDPARITAAIGPSIGSCCYEINEETGNQIEKAAGCFREVVFSRGSSIYADLKKACKNQLTEAGVPETSIETSPLCTKCHSDRFFSHRQEGSPSGRFSAFIYLCPKE